MQYSIPQIGEYVDGVSPYISKKALDERQKGLRFLDRNFGGFTLDNIAKLNVVAVRNHYRTLHTRQTLVRYFNDVSLFMEWCKNTGLIKSHNWGREMYQDMGDDSPFRYQLKERKEPMATVKVTERQGIARSTEQKSTPVRIVRPGMGQASSPVRQGIGQSDEFVDFQDKTLLEAIEAVGAIDTGFKELVEPRIKKGVQFVTYNDYVWLVNCVTDNASNIPTKKLRARLIRARLREKDRKLNRSRHSWWVAKSLVDYYELPVEWFKDYEMHKVHSTRGGFDAYTKYNERAKAAMQSKLAKNQGIYSTVATYMGVGSEYVARMASTGCCYQGFHAMAIYCDVPALRTSDVKDDNSFYYLSCIQRLINEATVRYAIKLRVAIPLHTDIQVCDIPRGSKRVDAALEIFEDLKPHIGVNLCRLLTEGFTKWESTDIIDRETLDKFSEAVAEELKVGDKNEEEEKSVPSQPKEIPTVELDDAVEYLKSMLSKYEDGQHIRDFVDRITDATLKADFERALAAFLERNPITSRKVENVEPRF